MARFLLTLLFVLPLTAWAQSPDKTGRLSGTVTDAATQETLIGVNVIVDGTALGTATDAEGRFVLDAVPVGSYRLTFRYLGYTPFTQTDIVVRSGRTTVVNAGLAEAILESEGVTVESGYYQKNQTELTSVTSFSTEEIRRAPGAAQEIVRVLNALPGVASRGETSQDLFVRGGSPMENGFYIDHVYIPNTAHFATGDGSSFGPTGLINTEFVEQIDFYTGGFSAAYGDRLSSISAIRYREGNPAGFSGEVGLNFSGGVALVEGPWAHRKGSFFVSARRSYLDLVAGAINAGGAPAFGDVQGKVTVRLNPRHTLSLLNLYGQSRFQQSAADALDEGENEFIDARHEQNTTGLTWRALWEGDGFTHTAASYSFRERDFASRHIDSEGLKLGENIRSDYAHLRSVSFYQLTPRVKAEFGGEVLYERSTFGLGQDAYTSRTGAEQPGFERDLNLDETRGGAFVSAIVRPAPRFQVTAGLRADYASLNEDVVLSPRLAGSYQLTSRLALNASAGLFHQSVPLYIIAQDDANRDLAHLQARHLIVGVDYLLTPDTKLTIEAYDKQYRDMPELADGNTLADPGYVLDNRGDFAGALASTGSASSRGLDVMVQKKLAEKVYGLASVSFFRSRYTDYRGIERSRSFDTRTLFNVIGGYKPNDKWEMSVRWSYAGGRPTTPLDEAASRSLGDAVLDVAQFHAERLPAYHSLFVRADRRFNFRAANLVTYVSLWNAYSRANVDELYWNVAEDRVDERNQFSLLPIMGLEFEF